jgi:hypothetical protein
MNPGDGRYTAAAVSETVACEFRGRTIWIYDTALSAWLIALIDHVSERGDQVAERLATTVEQARRTAVLGSDTVFDPDSGLDPDAASVFIAIAAEVSERLRDSGGIDWQVLARRPVFHGLSPKPRWGFLPTVEDVASVGDTFVAMANGSLPPPPDGRWWMVGWPGGRKTIKMTASAPPG